MQKLYVLVRTDLKGSSPAVQAGHAVAQWMLEHPSTDWVNQTLVYLNIGNADALHKWKSKIHYKDMDYSTFTEPDLNDETTAIACLTDKKLFNGLPLL